MCQIVEIDSKISIEKALYELVASVPGKAILSTINPDEAGEVVPEGVFMKLSSGLDVAESMLA